jgi:hypothetical protein
VSVIAHFAFERKDEVLGNISRMAGLLFGEAPGSGMASILVCRRAAIGRFTPASPPKKEKAILGGPFLSEQLVPNIADY